MAVCAIAPSRLQVDYATFPVRRFGVEVEYGQDDILECAAQEISRADPKRPAEVYEEYRKSETKEAWHVKLDHSCGDRVGDYGMEVASPILHGWKDLVILGKVVRAIASVGARPNPRCAIHVHAAASDMDKSKMAGLLATWMKVEWVWLAAVEARRRRSTYCQPLTKALAAVISPQRTYTEMEFMHAFESKNVQRKVAFSVWRCYQEDERNRWTVELRLPEATSSSEDIMNWCRVFLRFVEFASAQAFPGNVSPCPDIKSCLQAMGLWSMEGRHLQLSVGLWKARAWLLDRIARLGPDQKVTDEANLLRRYTLPNAT